MPSTIISALHFTICKSQRMSFSLLVANTGIVTRYMWYLAYQQAADTARLTPRDMSHSIKKSST